MLLKVGLLVWYSSKKKKSERFDWFLTLKKVSTPQSFVPIHQNWLQEREVKKVFWLKKKSDLFFSIKYNVSPFIVQIKFNW